jgi:CheY-like chemotaxis protein
MHEPPLLLVVDDNADNRAILVARLESQGFATAEAEDGPEALEAVLRLRPDLLLLDVMMPGMDGLEVTRRLKADPALPFTPILLVTARTAVQDVVQGLEAGAARGRERRPAVARA